MFSLLMARLGATIVTSMQIGGVGRQPILPSVTAATQQASSTAPAQPATPAPPSPVEKINLIQDQSLIKGMESIVTPTEKQMLQHLKTAPGPIPLAQMTQIDEIVSRLKAAMDTQVAQVATKWGGHAQQSFSDLIETRTTLVTELQNARNPEAMAHAEAKLLAVDTCITQKIVDPANLHKYEKYKQVAGDHFNEAMKNAIASDHALADSARNYPNLPKSVSEMLGYVTSDTIGGDEIAVNNSNQPVVLLAVAQNPTTERGMRDNLIAGARRDFDGLVESLSRNIQDINTETAKIDGLMRKGIETNALDKQIEHLNADGINTTELRKLITDSRNQRLDTSVLDKLITSLGQWRVNTAELEKQIGDFRNNLRIDPSAPEVRLQRHRGLRIDTTELKGQREYLKGLENRQEVFRSRRTEVNNAITAFLNNSANCALIIMSTPQSYGRGSEERGLVEKAIDNGFEHVANYSKSGTEAQQADAKRQAVSQLAEMMHSLINSTDAGYVSKGLRLLSANSDIKDAVLGQLSRNTQATTFILAHCQSLVPQEWVNSARERFGLLGR